MMKRIGKAPTQVPSSKPHLKSELPKPAYVRTRQRQTATQTNTAAQFSAIDEDALTTFFGTAPTPSKSSSNLGLDLGLKGLAPANGLDVPVPMTPRESPRECLIRDGFLDASSEPEPEEVDAVIGDTNALVRAQLLRIELRGLAGESDRILGGVDVPVDTEAWMLSDVRTSIIADAIQGVPRAFRFVVDGIPVSRRQEARRRAADCFPQVAIEPDVLPSDTLALPKIMRVELRASDESDCGAAQLLGGVDVPEDLDSWTLADVRSSILKDGLPGVPRAFRFIIENVPVSYRQEMRRRAMDCFPQVVISQDLMVADNSEPEAYDISDTTDIENEYLNWDTLSRPCVASIAAAEVTK